MIDIDENQPGYKHFKLAPHIGKGALTKASSKLETIYGQIVSAKTIDNDELVYNIKIPINTTATETLPYTRIADVRINNNLLDKKATPKMAAMFLLKWAQENISSDIQLDIWKSKFPQTIKDYIEQTTRGCPILNSLFCTTFFIP